MRVGCARPQDADKLPGCRHARWVRETARRTQARWVVHRAGGAAAYRTHTIPLGSPSRGTHTRAAGRTQEPRDAHKSRGTHTRAAGRTQEPRDAHKGRPYYGRALVLFACVARKTDVSLPAWERRMDTRCYPGHVPCPRHQPGHASLLREKCHHAPNPRHQPGHASLLREKCHHAPNPRP